MSAECWQSACSITEHAFLQLICTISFNALKAYKISMFSKLSWLQETSQWLLPVDVHGNQLKQQTVIIAYILKVSSWNK